MDTGGGADPGTQSNTVDWYRNFGLFEARGQSDCYAEWSLAISDDPQLLALIDALPYAKRQPNLVLAAARFVGAGITPYAEFRRFVLSRWPKVRQVILARSTQTNEPGRCAVFLPSLAGIAAAEGKPLALLEVGASAGLVLFPDRYRYQYNGGPILAGPASAPDAPVLPCAMTGSAPLPAEPPTISWRAGIDLNPLDSTNNDDVAWLQALIWPEQEFRRRLRAALQMARQDPPRLVAGDLNQRLAEVVAEAPTEAAVVVLHSAVLAYLAPPARRKFAQTVREFGVHWLSNEGVQVLPQPGDAPEGIDADHVRGRFVLRHNGHAVALTGPHGQSLDWL
ncbi:DUF2332 domain-containing protein [Arthrobacter crystallopoietes]|uniref:DUF2332 domain-containing protein n=1 Tax=Crystallibacter crystallopoietes TaxID=37928 RepID=UPI0011115BF0|nr:DUF2332 domain-containing protein [Arthrobacter crystallopoietes]